MKKYSASVPLDEVFAEAEKDPRWAQAYAKAEIDTQLALEIAMARDRSRMTQAQLAEALGTTQSTVSRIEQAGQNLTVGTLAKIAKALGRRLRIQLL